MKAILLLGLFAFLFQPVQSQVYVKRKNLNADSSIRFFQITMNAENNKSFYVYSVDYGQRQQFLFNFHNYYIADASGKKKKFHSSVDLLHHITSNGWKLIQRDLVRTTNSIDEYLLFERVEATPGSNIENGSPQLINIAPFH